MKTLLAHINSLALNFLSRIKVKSLALTTFLFLTFVQSLCSADDGTGYTPPSSKMTLNCASTQVRYVAINELYNGGGGSGNLEFVEIYFNEETSISNWRLYFNDNNTHKYINLGSGLGDVRYPNGLTGSDNVATYPKGTFIVYQLDGIDPTNGEIFLVNTSSALSSGSSVVIDYFNYYKNSPQTNYNVTGSCSTTLSGTNSNAKDLSRLTDGSGGFYQYYPGTSDEVNQSSGSSNLGGSAGKYFSTDIAISKTVKESTVYLGDEVEYTIAIANDGNYTATNLKVKDLFPSTYLDYNRSEQLYGGSSSWSCGTISSAGSEYTLTIPTLPKATTCQWKLYGKVKSTITTPVSGVINQASYLSMDQNESNVVNNTSSVAINIGLVRPPIADWHFDECSWNGTSGEVKDGSGNGYHGALKLKTMTLENSKLCRGPAQFNDDSYIELANFPNLTSSMTIAAWFKTTDIAASGQRIFADDESNGQSNAGGYALSVGDGGSGTLRFYDRSQSNSGIIDSNAVLQNNTWYFAAGVTDVANAKRTLYLFDSSGNLIGGTPKVLNMTNTSRGSDSGVASIGGETASGETDNRFKGSIDEVKVYASALTQEQLVTVIQNEIAGKNYDGTTHTCTSCGLPTCYTDDFNRTDLGSKWSIIKAYNFTPAIQSSKLVLTSNKANIASGVSLIGDFPSSNNLIEIEFENNAYGGTGADGVAVVLSDANVTPVAGGFGGSLGYAPKDSVAGFTGAWLGFGIDEFGNFSRDGDGNKGRTCISPYKNNTQVVDSLTIRGRGANNNFDGYCFIANSGGLTPGIDATTAQNHKYKFIIDTRSGTKITVKRDVNNTGYVTLPNMNEIDATQTATAPQNFKLSFTGSTGGSNNWHTFDNLSIKALYCGTLGQDKNITSSFFDAWDTSGDIAHRSIQTKIVKNDFMLNVVGLNETNTAYQDFNGTVCARLVDSNDKNLTAWNKLLFTGANLQTTTFNSSYASKDARVALSWKKNVDTTCPISVEDNNTKSTDHFAIRPNKFTISKSNATAAYAGDIFTLDFKALNNSDGNCLDYNETKDGSFTVTSVIGKNGCSNGVLSVANFSFADGQKLLVDSNFTDTGDINITIQERPTFEFSKIDASDTADTVRYITPTTMVLNVKPYELNITDANFTASTGQNWLYDANVSDMYVTAHATVQANNKQHTALQNFTSSCYAQPVDLGFYYDANTTNSNTNLSYSVINGVMSSAIKAFSDINKTITIPAASFSTASASADYRFNIDRAYNLPLTPVDILLKDVKVTSTAIAKDENNASVNQAKRFYYGRLKTKDIATDKTSAPHVLHVEVFSTTPLSGFYQNSLNWWINASDDGVTTTTDINLSAYKDFKKTTPSTLVSATNKVGLMDGKLDFSLVKVSSSENQATFHLDIPSWLWFSPLKEYNTSIGSTCAEHPCFEYRFLDNATNVGIKSGELKGATIGKDFNSTYQKSGVKTFR